MGILSLLSFEGCGHSGGDVAGEVLPLQASCWLAVVVLGDDRVGLDLGTESRNGWLGVRDNVHGQRRPKTMSVLWEIVSFGTPSVLGIMRPSADGEHGRAFPGIMIRWTR
jgi:hypothetical protein